MVHDTRIIGLRIFHPAFSEVLRKNKISRCLKHKISAPFLYKAELIKFEFFASIVRKTFGK